MKSRGLPFELPLSLGYGENTPASPNHIRRPWGMECWLIEFTVAGYVQVTDPAGGEHSFSRGDFFCYRPACPQHYQLRPGERRWNHYWVCFVPSENLRRWLQWKELFPGFHALHINDSRQQKKIEGLFKEAVAMATSHYFHRDAMINNLTEQILLWAETENSQNPSSAMDERIVKSLAYLDKSSGRLVSVEDLARAAGLSISRFAHLFRQVMGLSPLRYAERRRVERAIESLRLTSEPISAVANRLGYQDPLHFSRIFRRVTGHSPSFYRHQYPVR